MLSSIAFAGPYGLNVWHPAGTITDGTFPGNYTFNGTLTVTRDISAGSAAKLIDLSGSGLGSDDYFLYMNAGNYWKYDDGTTPSLRLGYDTRGYTDFTYHGFDSHADPGWNDNFTIGFTGGSAAYGNMNFIVQGIEAMRLDRNGNVNIGSGDLFTNTTSGNVGIGTTSPTQTLTVAGTLNVTSFVTTNRMFNNTIIVAKNGGDFNTIAKAIESITDNNASNLYVIRVMPGVYQENITMKPYVDIIGSGWYATKITQADNNITIAESIQNATIADLTLELTGPTGSNTAAIRIDSASITVDHVRFIVAGGSGTDMILMKNSGKSRIINSYFWSFGSGSNGGRMISGAYGFTGTATVSNNIMEGGCYVGMILSDGGIINSSYNIISCSDSDFWLNNAGSTINSYKDTYSKPVHNEGGIFNKKDYWLDAQGVNTWAILSLGARAFVNGSSGGTFIGINSPSTFGGNYLDFKRDGVGRSDFVVNGTGAVGIGTTDFTTGGFNNRFVLKQSTNAAYAGLAVEDASKTNVFSIDYDGSNFVMGSSYRNSGSGGSYTSLAFTTSNLERMRIVNTSGNVGIGTTAPGAKLAVNGDITSKPDSYTKLLFHMDGIDGSTTFTDETGKTVTVNGSAQIDTAQSKFGGASGLFNGTTDYLSLADSDDWNFGSGNFTIDFWVMPNALPAINDYFYDQFADGGGNNRTLFAFVGSGKSLSFLSVINGVTKADYNTTTAVNWVLGKWYHIAVVRNGTNLYIFQDGVSQALTVNTAIGTNDLGDVLGNLTIGINDGNPIGDRYFNGWIDEYRVSKGIARWTTNFTPPNAPHGGMDGIGLSGIVSSQWTSTGSNIFYNSGNVGIGTTSPLNKTHIYNGTMLIEYGANTENTYSMIQLDKIDQISSKYLRLGIGGNGYREGIISGAQGLQLNSDGDNANYYISFSTAGTERVRIGNTGNLGINTTSPTGLFQVNGNATQTSFIVKHDFARGRATVGIGTDNPSRVGHEGSVLTLVANSSYSGTQNNAIEFVVDGKDSGSGGFIEWLAAGNRYAILGASKQGEANDTGYMNFQTMNAGVGAERMRITETGFIGINTTTPAGILHVATNGVDALVVQNQTGNVGIGTTGPLAKVHISGGNLLFDNVDELRWKDSSAVQRGVLIGSATDYTLLRSLGAGIQFEDVNALKLMTILNGGNVGIGTTSPNATLNVRGGVNVTGSVNLATLEGNVGIGTTSPNAKLNVFGSVTVNGTVRWLENITVWVPITLLNSTDLTVMDFNGYLIKGMADGVSTTAGAVWYVPENVVKVVSVTPVFLSDGTGNVVYNLTVTAAADSETYNTHQATGGTKTIALTFNKRGDGAEENSTQITAISNLASGDIVGLKIVRYGGSADDTVNNWVEPVGFKVKIETNGVV